MVRSSLEDVEPEQNKFRPPKRDKKAYLYTGAPSHWGVLLPQFLNTRLAGYQLFIDSEPKTRQPDVNLFCGPWTMNRWAVDVAMASGL